jgi:hypothetical protein
MLIGANMNKESVMNACGMAPGRRRWPSKLGAIFSKPWGRVKHKILEMGDCKLQYIQLLQKKKVQIVQKNACNFDN